MINLYVIGCGGIGGYLIDMLPMAISSLSLDVIEASGRSIETQLKNAGSVSVPSVVDRLTLIDGDTFTPRNAIRQGMGAGSKLAQRMRGIKDSMLCRSYLQRMQIKGFNAYVNPDNVEEMIPLIPSPNKDNYSEFMDIITSLEIPDVLKAGLSNESLYAQGSPIGNGVNDRLHSTVVMLGVDNVKTRYEISKYMERFDNCLVINGGNEKTSGHVTLYERCNGIAIDPNIYEVYPNIRPDADERPDEAACTEVAPKHDQIAITNNIVSTIMISCFVKWVRQGLYNIKKKQLHRFNEVLVDTEKLSMTTLYHPLAQ